MSENEVAKITAEGNTRNKAMENALQKANTHVSNIQGIQVENIKATVESNKISKYRLKAVVIHEPER